MATNTNPTPDFTDRIDTPEGWEPNRSMLGDGCVAAFRTESFDWFADAYEYTGEQPFDYLVELSRQVGGDESFVTELEHRVLCAEGELSDAFEQAFGKYEDYDDE